MFALRLLAIAAGALALRVLLTVVLTPHIRAIGDFYAYHELANTLASGYGFVDPASTKYGPAVPTAGHPPLWPELLSLVSRLGGDGAPIGTRGQDGFMAHRLTGAFVGTATVIAIGYLGRRVAGARVGLVAAALAAIYPVMVAADGSLMPETLFGLCVAVAMLLAYRVLDAPNGWWALALGFAIGVSSLARSEGLFLLFLLALPVIWRRGIPGRVIAGRAALACLGLAVAIAPWTVRNWERFDQPVIGSTNQGSLVAGSNCDDTYYGRDIGLWHIPCVGPVLPGENEAETSSRQRRQGADYAFDHAGRVPVVVAVRILRTWDLYQPWRGATFNEGRNVTASRVGLISFWLLLALAIPGAVVLYRRHAPLRVLVAPVLLVSLASALGSGTTRYRHAAEISVVILAAVAVSAALDRRRASRELASHRQPVPEAA
jgi:4-amino-4-deoxy-L-arabinose transferase-like glycosyltransferase